MTSGAASPSSVDPEDGFRPALVATVLATAPVCVPKIVERKRVPRSTSGDFASPPAPIRSPGLRAAPGSMLRSISRSMSCRMIPLSPDFASRPARMAGNAELSPRDTFPCDSPSTVDAWETRSGVRRPRSVSIRVAIGSLLFVRSGCVRRPVAALVGNGKAISGLSDELSGRREDTVSAAY